MPYFTTNKELRQGTKLRKMDTSGLHRARMKAELVTEEVRSTGYPSRPSRLTSVFVAPTFKSAREWNDTFRARYIYEVKTSGGGFIASGGIFTEIVSSAFDDNDERAEYYANMYWRGKGNELPEMLVSSAVIERPVWILGVGPVDEHGNRAAMNMVASCLANLAKTLVEL
jgi:hypothetical protein